MRDPIHEREHLIATNYVGLASYMFLIYDHLLTFSDEVNYVWKGRKGPIIYLFLLNRYFFPLAFIVNLYAYLSPDFSYEMCMHFVHYEGATVIIGLGLAGLMMILRVNALYGGNCRSVQALLGTLWIFQIGIYSWLLSTGRPVPHSSGIHSCSLIFDPSRKGFASLSAAAPLVFDTAVLLLTLHKTVGALRESRLGLGANNTLLTTLVKDGVLYYSVVFSANLTLTIMIYTASPGLKNILGQFAQLITVTMMSRITLHLRKIGATRNVTVVSRSSASPSTYCCDGTVTVTGSMPESAMSFVTPTFSTVGAMESYGDPGSSSGTGSESSVNSAMYAPQLVEKQSDGTWPATAMESVPSARQPESVEARRDTRTTGLHAV